MIFLPPRHTKSELSSRRFPAWCVGRHPSWQFIHSTYSGDFAADFGREVRGIVKTSQYQKIFPGTKLSEDSQAAARWNTQKGGSYVAAGVGGALTGRGAHIAMIDDPFKDWQAAYSPVIRESIWKWYLTVLRTRLMPGGAIVLVMTRWHDDDLAGRLIKQMKSGDGDQWDILSLPGLVETEEQEKSDALGRKIGDALWPEWFDSENLKATKKLMPVFEWSALYQQTPVPESGNLFKREWFNWYKKIPEHGNFYITFDGALTDDDGDFTEIAVWLVDQYDDIYAVDWWGGQVTMDKWINVILNLVKKWSPSYVVGEVGQIRRASESLIKKRMKKTRIHAVLKWLPHIGDKVVKCAAFRGLASMGSVYLPYEKPWAVRVINHLLRFPAGEYDDIADTCGLIGRSINSTFAARVPKPVAKQDMHAPPTLDELLRLDSQDTTYEGRL